MATTKTTQRIEICRDGVWAGSGRLVNDTIQDVPIQWCDDTDESDDVYEAIEDAILEGKDEVAVDLADGTRLNLTWTITSAD